MAGRRPLLAWAKSPTVAQVVAIAAGILAMASGIVIRRIVMSATAPGYAASWLPWRDQWHSVTVAGAGVLVAIVALAMRGRARWLHIPQIGLWLLVLHSSIGMADLAAMTGLRPVFAWLVVGDVPGAVTIVLLALSLPSRQASRS